MAEGSKAAQAPGTAAAEAATAARPIMCSGHSRPVRRLQFFEARDEGTFLASACIDRTAMVRDGDSGDWIGSFLGHKGAVWSVAVADDGRRAATGSADRTVRLWNAIDGKQLDSADVDHTCKAVAFSHHDAAPLLAAGGNDKVVRVFETAGDSLKLRHEVRVGETDIHTVCFAASNPNQLLVGDGDSRVAVVDVSDGSFTRGEAELAAPVREIRLAPVEGAPSRFVVSAGDKVSLLDADTLVLVSQVSIDGLEQVDTADLDPVRGEVLAVSGGEDELRVTIASATDGSHLATLRGHHGPVRCLRFHPRGEVLASASEDGTVRLWPRQMVLPKAPVAEA